MVWFEKPERIDTAILGVLVQRACGGDLHDGVRGPPMWRSQDAQRAVDEQVEELEATYGKRPVDGDPSWREVAELLSTPSEARFGRISYSLKGTHYDVFAARDDLFGLIAVTDAESTHLRTFRPDEQPAEVIVAALAKWVRKPSGEQPVHITRSELDSSDSTHGLREAPAHLIHVRELMRLPVHLTCEFYAECRRPGSGRKRTRRPLLVYSLGVDQRTATTWTMRVIPSGDDANVDLAPADIDDITTRIEDLRRELG